jgi:hypothetical protein
MGFLLLGQTDGNKIQKDEKENVSFALEEITCQKSS